MSEWKLATEIPELTLSPNDEVMESHSAYMLVLTPLHHSGRFIYGIGFYGQEHDGHKGWYSHTWDPIIVSHYQPLPPLPTT